MINFSNLSAIKSIKTIDNLADPSDSLLSLLTNQNFTTNLELEEESDEHSVDDESHGDMFFNRNRTGYEIVILLTWNMPIQLLWGKQELKIK